MRHGARSPQALERLARRSIALLALPLAACLLLVGPAHVVLHGHGGSSDCEHGGHGGDHLPSRAHAAAASGPATSADAEAGHAGHELLEAHAGAEDCQLCLFAGAPVAHTAVAPNGPTAPPLRVRPAPSTRPSSPCTGLPAPRGPPALG